MEMSSNTKNPRFGEEQKSRLANEFGLNSEQIFRLERTLRNIRFELTRSAPATDVVEALQKLDSEIQSANRRVGRWKKMQQPSFGAEALGLLNMTECLLDPEEWELGWPKKIVGSDVLSLLAKITALAAKSAPNEKRPGSQTQRNKAISVRESKRAIEWIVLALGRPSDDQSRAVAKKLRVSRRPTRHGGFWNLAVLVFAAAMGRDEFEVNPTRCIASYLESVKGL